MILEWLERSRMWLPCGSNWWTMLVLTNQLRFLITYILDAFKVNANRTKLLLLRTEKCSNHEFSVGATEKLPGWEEPHAKTVAWSYDMEGHAKKCVERYCGEFANKNTVQLYKVSVPSLDDHHFKKEEVEPVGALSTVCLQMVFKCLYKVRIGRLDFLWSVNKLARSPNGQELVTDDWRAWFHTSITQQTEVRLPGAHTPKSSVTDCDGHWKEALVEKRHTARLRFKEGEWEVICRGVIDGKESAKPNVWSFCTNTLWSSRCAKECAKRIPTASTVFNIRGVNSVWVYDHSAKKLVVEPPVSVDPSFCSAALHDVSYVTFFFLRWSSPHETVFGQLTPLVFFLLSTAPAHTSP